MTVTSNVPRPTFGPQGFSPPTEAEILAGVQADLNSAFGGNLDPDLSTPQGQIAMTETAVIGDKNASFLYYTQQVDPALNEGRMQDAIGRIYYMERIPGAPTVVQATCRGLDGVVIPVGAVARAQDGNLYVCTLAGEIVGGEVTLPFSCSVNGPIVCPEGTLDTIYQAIFGWESVTNAANGVTGVDVESPSAFEARRAASVAVNARSILDAVQGAVYAVDGVLDCYVTENVEPYIKTIGGVPLAAHSLYVCALGGEAADIAMAIWTKKSPGCGYNGNTTVVIQEPSTLYVPPVPTYRVTFELPTAVDFAVQVVLKSNPGIPNDALDQIRTAVLAAFSGSDGGQRARIGSTVFASRYYSGVAALGRWSQIVDIQLGINGGAAAFTASTVGTVLSVTEVARGQIKIGQLLQDVDEVLLTGTTVTGYLTGNGGVGTYSISKAQAVSSELMSATELVNDVVMNINQAPALAGENIHLALEP